MTDRLSVVYVVDDDQDIRSSLSRALGQRGFDVRPYDSAAEFLDGYDAETAGCVVLDYGMPGMKTTLHAVINELTNAASGLLPEKWSII